MQLIIKKGTTSKRIPIKIKDSSSSTGAGLTGLTNASSGLTWYYWREDAGNTGGVSVSVVSATLGTWTSGGFIQKDATFVRGQYEIGIPDAALATGASWVTMQLRGVTNMAETDIIIQLVSYDPDDAVRMGQTALPNAAAEAAGGLYTRGSGAGQITQDANGRINSNLTAIVGNTGGPVQLDRSTRGIVTGTVTTGVTTTSIPTSVMLPAASVADQFKGRIVTFDKDTTTAALRGQSTDITANTSGGTLTVTALTTSPVSGDTFTIT